MIVLLSRLLAVRTSKYTALVPPTNEFASTAWAIWRIPGMSFPASTLSGALFRVTLRIAFPSTI